MICHVIWFGRSPGSEAMRIEVWADTNVCCLDLARGIWDKLSAEGWHMKNTRP